MVGGSHFSYATLTKMKSCGAGRPEVSVMRMSVTFGAAFLSAIVLLTAWSVSMLPRARDVAVTIQAPFSKQMPLRESRCRFGLCTPAHLDLRDPGLCLDPAEHLLNPLAQDLAYPIPGMPGGASIDGRLSDSGGVHTPH